MNYITLFITIIFVVFVFLIYVKYDIYTLKNSNSISIDEAYNIAQTGDLILFRYHDNLIYDLFTYFSHVGLVLEINNIKYIIETNPKEEPFVSEGVHLYDFKNRLRINNGFTFLLKLNTNIDTINIQTFIQNINTYKQNILFQEEDNYIRNNCILNRFTNAKYENIDENIDENINKMNCSEFVGFCLNELKIVDNFKYKCILPNDFIYVKNNKKTLYKNLIQIF